MGNYFIEEEDFSEVYFVVEFISKLLPQGLLGLAGFSFSLAWVLITVQAREAQKKPGGGEGTSIVILYLSTMSILP